MLEFIFWNHKLIYTKNILLMVYRVIVYFYLQTYIKLKKLHALSLRANYTDIKFINVTYYLIC
jgi:hypothetical protein